MRLPFSVNLPWFVVSRFACRFHSGLLFTPSWVVSKGGATIADQGRMRVVHCYCKTHKVADGVW